MLLYSRLLMFSALLTAPAWGTTLYSDGAINGTSNAQYLDQGYAVSDSFVLSSDSTLTGVSNIGIWVTGGDTLTSFDWIISTSPGGAGTLEGSGSGFSSATELTPTSSYGNSGAYNVYNVGFTISDLVLTAGTYYLTLQNATSSAGIVAWDWNYIGSSTAYYYYGGVQYAGFSSPFEIDGTVDTPEPNEMVLLATGLAALAALTLRKKIHASRA